MGQPPLPVAPRTPTQNSSVIKPNGVAGNGHVNNADVPIELNARTMARDCLKEVGREMGVSRWLS